MFGPDGDNAVAARPAGPAGAGTPGQWLTDGDPAATPPKPRARLRSWLLNIWLAEIRNLLTAAGIVESLGDESQVLEAIRGLIGRRGRAVAQITGTAQWAFPPGVHLVRFRAVGAGGAGGGCVPGQGGYSGGGGGAGGYAEGYIPGGPGDVLTITMGAGGLPVAAGTGGNGGSVTIATATAVVAQCQGGYGGSASSGASSASGGASAAGTVAGINGFGLTGGYGGDGDATNGNNRGGVGGASAFGGGGRPGTAFGVDGLAPGSGGGGAYAPGTTGGHGAPPMVFLDWGF